MCVMWLQVRGDGGEQPCRPPDHAPGSGALALLRIQPEPAAQHAAGHAFLPRTEPGAACEALQQQPAPRQSCGICLVCLQHCQHCVSKPDLAFFFEERGKEVLGQSSRKPSEVMHEKAWISYIDKEPLHICTMRT